MAPHSSVLAWRIPGTGEPGGLPSMGSHRVGHDWSDLAAATGSVRSNSKSVRRPYDFLKHLQESTLNLSGPQRRIFLSNIAFVSTLRPCFFDNTADFILFIYFFNFSFFEFHLQDIKTVKEKDVFFFFPWASNNIFLNFFQSSIDILFKDWWESICLLPKSACHRLFMKLSKFLVLCPNYGLVFYLLNVKSPKHNQFILLMVLWVKI